MPNSEENFVQERPTYCQEKGKLLVLNHCIEKYEWTTTTDQTFKGATTKKMALG